MDDDEVAFKEKQKAGMFLLFFLVFRQLADWLFLVYSRCQGNEGYAGKGQGQGSDERWQPGY